MTKFIYNYFLNYQLKKIEHYIKNSKISVISFDIFDTLLLRPAINPRDIFYLISEKSKSVYNIDFAKIRYNAEDLLNTSNYTIYDVWDAIAIKENLSDDLKDRLLNLEVESEKQLLYPRILVKELYELACKYNKKIIAISDMYLPENILKGILSQKGYDKIDKIYVSCDCKCRKDTGELYNYVLNKESIKPNQLLHIGDNRYSDFKMAKKLDIHSVFLPSNIKLFSKAYSLNSKDLLFKDPLFSILFGYSINAFFESTKNSNYFKMTLSKFSCLFLFPILSRVSFFCLNNPTIKNEYEKIWFASRDGYLPLLAYNIIRKKFKNALPAEYLYASRLAYGCATENSFYDCENILKFSFTLQKLIDLKVLDNSLRENLINNLTDSELKLLVNESSLREALERFEPSLSEYFIKKKMLCSTYYSNLIPKSKKRVLVYDTGYSGSISIGISTALSSKYFIDKIYLWEKDANKVLDKQNGTKTFVLLKDNSYQVFDILMENLSSPFEGTCLGFIDENKIPKPCSNKITYTPQMKNDINTLHSSAIDTIDNFSDLLKDYCLYFNICNLDGLDKLFRALFSNSVSNSEIFNNIIFVDDFMNGKPISIMNTVLSSRSMHVLFYKALKRIQIIIQRKYKSK